MSLLKKISNLSVGGGKFNVQDANTVSLGDLGQHISTDGTVAGERERTDSKVLEASVGAGTALSSAEFFSRFGNAGTSAVASSTAAAPVKMTALARTDVVGLIEFFSKAELGFGEATANSTSGFNTAANNVTLTTADGRSKLEVSSEVLTKIRSQFVAYLKTDVFAELKNVDVQTELKGLKVSVGPTSRVDSKLVQGNDAVFATFESEVAEARPVSATYESQGEGTVTVTVSSEVLAALQQLLANEANSPVLK